MNNWDSFMATSGAYVFNVVSAVAILVVGWVLAWILSALVRKGLARTTLHRTLISDVGGEVSEQGGAISIAGSRVLYSSF